ncbi:hypothetical protein GBA52_027832, partial [Prunus armeniaca]
LCSNFEACLFSNSTAEALMYTMSFAVAATSVKLENRMSFQYKKPMKAGNRLYLQLQVSSLPLLPPTSAAQS